MIGIGLELCGDTMLFTFCKTLTSFAAKPDISSSGSVFKDYDTKKE